ncbi:MAG: hypothetical protein QXI16_06430 [Sulfolobaceae archaeon]
MTDKEVIKTIKSLIDDKLSDIKMALKESKIDEISEVYLSKTLDMLEFYIGVLNILCDKCNNYNNYKGGDE